MRNKRHLVFRARHARLHVAAIARSCPSAADKLNTSYISTTPGSSSVLWVAKDARIFDKHGIDATVIFISGSVRGIQSILAGEIAIGEGGGPGLASARLAGGDVVAIAGNVNVLPYYLVSQPSIKKHEDLRGKIGGTHIAGTTAEFALKVGLKKIGLDPLKDVSLRVIGGAIERMVALQKGIVNFTVVTEAGKAMAERLGYPTVVAWLPAPGKPAKSMAIGCKLSIISLAPFLAASRDWNLTSLRFPSA